MTRSLLPAFFIVVGPGETLVIVADTLGMPGAARFRTLVHAESVPEKLLADGTEHRVRAAFRPGAEA